MKIEAKARLFATKSLTVNEWKKEVSKSWPKAKFILEDGNRGTNGDVGEWTAVKGKDMQADVVGVFTPEFCFVTNPHDLGDQQEFGSKV